VKNQKSPIRWAAGTRADQNWAPQPLQQLGVAKLDRVHVHGNRTLNAPPAALFHPPPVAVGHLHDLIGGDNQYAQQNNPIRESFWLSLIVFNRLNTGLPAP